MPWQKRTPVAELIRKGYITLSEWYELREALRLPRGSNVSLWASFLQGCQAIATEGGVRFVSIESGFLIEADPGGWTLSLLYLSDSGESCGLLARFAER